MTIRILAVTLGLALAAPVAQAGTVGGFTSFFAFGDSLTDNGNLFGFTGQPGAPYVDGRFSNGPVWAEHVAADFSAEGLATANLAFGGARAVTNADGIPDLPLQLGLFTSVPQAAYGTNPLASLWFGANDLFGALENFATLGLPGVMDAAKAAAKAVADGAKVLASMGIDDFLVFNLPDLGATPRFSLLQPGAKDVASAASIAFNAELDAQIDALRLASLNVIEIDAFALFNDLIAKPTDFGVLDATTPCYIPGVVTCTDDQAKLLAFFDPVHPTAVIHREIAAVAQQTIAAQVPLPAAASLLVLALGGLGFVARRKAA